MILLTLLIFSLIVSTAYTKNLRRSVENAPRTGKSPAQQSAPSTAQFPKISVIVPAYNEAENIRDCAIAILESTPLSVDNLEVLIVDDRSTDDTLAIAQTLQQQVNDPRLKILAGQPRPANEYWAGKNWACAQAVEVATGDFLLFIDADVRLKPLAIETALETVETEKIDLLTCMPALVCECFAEWLVQPLMFNHLAVCFDFTAVNDPTVDSAFAAGPFMLFRRSAYEKIGGHEAVAGEIVEDVELSRRIKRAGLKLGLYAGSNLAFVRMYRSWSALWEGWTKNLYLGANRSWGMMVYMAAIMLFLYPIPWIGLFIILKQIISLFILPSPLGGGFTSSFFILPEFPPLGGVGGGDFFHLPSSIFLKRFLSGVEGPSSLLAIIVIWQQYNLRRLGAEISDCSTKYWWLGGLGGTLVAAIAIGSAIKTETGWGWTWRGRPLQIKS
ncbi:MAG: glycosyltransferase [Oscillatoriales cyanobacterium]|uniref:Glycosyltransferase family 2 protein n=1 Tax=Microcoleus anatoxicus PTRS2 TaxID=2705321 RepID=A0ABU8YIY6_9CYAN|nr:MAG: glycosyltransferase [Oscillatoriales cyanobacterium]TAE06842.1 MAG: glycosyltransferase [Oscillatoriales cyanobacterium]TAF44363.1 MAG: glycosyltransferase [Oscillatoriales cyanobacterium]